MRLHLIRNATLRLEYGGRALLVDPCLDGARAWEPIEGILNPQRNPVCDLPERPEHVVSGVDGVLVSHRHIDHWDETARRLLRRALPLACQPSDQTAFEDEGFSAVHACGPEPASWLGMDLARTEGHHSNGLSRQLLDPVSGFVLRDAGEPTLWIVGDSVWCREVEEALSRHAPDVIVVNTGAARQLDGERITMDAEDIERVLRAAPGATVVAVHLQAMGHCTLTRAALRDELAAFGGRLLVPEDGQRLTL